MNLKLNQCVTEMNYVTYASSDSSDAASDLSNNVDCSLGTNPFGSSINSKKTLVDLIGIMDLSMLDHYPHNNQVLINAIINYWNIDIKAHEQLFLGNGSMDLLSKATRLLLSSGSKVLGYIPQFPEFRNEVEMMGGNYDYMSLKAEKNYKFNGDEMLNLINYSHQIVYIDNPNNPTGQIIPLEEISEIVIEAARYGICVIIDEAYGDFMPRVNSAINLLKKHNNIIVLRSFSKGLGLAGIRAGYLLTSSILGQYFERVSNPFSLNSLAPILCEFTLKNSDFMDLSIQKTIQYKRRIMESNCKLRIFETSLMTPIMVMQHTDETYDLEKYFEDCGIKVISGSGFDSLGRSAVRFRIPGNDADLNKVINAL